MAPSAVTLLLSEGLGSSPGGYGSSLFAPTAGRLVMCAVMLSSAGPPSPDDQFCSMASNLVSDFVQVGPSLPFASIATPAVRCTLWKAVGKAGAAAQAFVGNAHATTEVVYSFFEITGADTTRPDLGVVTTAPATGAADTGVNAATSTLPTFTAGGITIAAFACPSSGTWTPEAGWIGLTAAAAAGSTVRVCYTLSADTTPTAVQSFTGVPWAAMAVEVTDTPAVAPPPGPTPLILRTSRLTN